MVVYFVHEYHDFLICFDLSQCWRDCRIRGSSSAAIGRRWKTSRQIYIHILALNEFSQSIFFSSGRRLSSSNCSFIVYCKRSSASPTSFCRHVYAQPSRTITIWTNREARKKHRYQKRLSEKLTYFLATLLDIRTSSYALNHIQTITMVYAIRGPTGMLTQATIYYFVWKGSFFVMF